MEHLVPKLLANAPVDEPIVVRVASSPDELEAIWAFRYAIYVREMGKPLASADHARAWLRDAADIDAVQLFVMDGASIVGAMRLHVGNAPHAVVHRIEAERFGAAERLGLVSKTMVAVGRRSSQVFAAMAQQAYRCFAAAGIEHVVLHCRPSLVRLYARLGFASYGVEFVDHEVGPQVAMHIAVAAAPPVLRRGAEREAA
jgi:predicted GNAT family N-acyltransferase